MCEAFAVGSLLLLDMTSVLPSAQSLLDDLRTLLIDDGTAMSACAAAHMLKVPVVLARKLLAVILSENRGEMHALCVVSGCKQGQRCVLLVPATTAAAAAASMDASPAADVQLYGVCRSASVDPELFFAREQGMTAHGVLERQSLAPVHHSGVSIRKASASRNVAARLTCDSLHWHVMLTQPVAPSGRHHVCSARPRRVAGGGGTCRRQRACAPPHPSASPLFSF